MILVREEERKEAERKRKKMLFAYILVACVYAATALLLLFLSPDRYLPFLIGNVVLTVVFGFFSIYFFTVGYDLAAKRAKLLDKISSALAERNYGVFLREEERMTVEGLEMRVLLLEVGEDEREVHVFESKQAFERGKKYLIEVRCGVLTEIDDVNE